MDVSTVDGAHELADKIRQFWIDRGYPAIKTQVFYVRGGNKDGRGGAPIWGITSNIGPRGYPPGGRNAQGPDQVARRR